jgi:NCS1 family nucleobase:cation symporter-1
LAAIVPGSARLWSILVGAIAVVVTLFGPRAMALFNRAAVPLLLVVGLALTAAIVGAGIGRLGGPGDGSLGILAGLDVVIGYQVSWSLMFADYTRFQRKESSAATAVVVAMALTSLWLVGLGAAAGRIGGANDPSAMILGAGLPVAALLLMALSTITTNFVNLYLSALAVRNLWHRAPPRPTVLLVGLVGTLFGLLSPNLLDRYAGFMGWIGTAFLPIAGIVVVHFFALHRGAANELRRWSAPAAIAWLAGVVTYQAAARLTPEVGATAPSLLVSATAYYWGMTRTAVRVSEEPAERRARPERS